MLYSLKARATVIAVMFASIAIGATGGGILAAAIGVQEFPVVSGISIGAGACGYLGLHLGEHIGRKIGVGIGY